MQVRRWVLILVAVAVLSLAIAQSQWALDSDAVEYWAAAKLMLSHLNPYSDVATAALQDSIGSHRLRMGMFNPPWTFTLILTLGFFGIRTAIAIWMFQLITAILGSVHLLWCFFGRQPGRTHLLLLLFMPAVACVQLGQSAAFVLLGLSLFLYLHQDHPALAGLSAPLMAIKPHLLLPFAIVAVLWSLRTGRWRFLVSAAGALLLSLMFPTAIDPKIFAQYRPVLRHANYVGAHSWNSSAFLHVFVPHSQYVLMLLVSIWGVMRFLRQRAWDWRSDGMLLLAASVAASPYWWFQDDVVTMPAILATLYAGAGRWRLLWPLGVLNSIALILALCSVQYANGMYCWSAPAWLLWYIYAARRLGMDQGLPSPGGETPARSLLTDEPTPQEHG